MPMSFKRWEKIMPVDKCHNHQPVNVMSIAQKYWQLIFKQQSINTNIYALRKNIFEKLKYILDIEYYNNIS
jgi:hypothetical protein